MKKDFLKYILVFGLVILSLCIWLLWRNASDKRIPQEIQQQATPNLKTTNAESSSSKDVTNLDVGHLEKSQTVTGMNPDERLKRTVQDVLGKNVPINFFGKVVDQNGQAVAGVNVEVSVRHWHYNPPSDLDSDFPRYNLKTDADGKFELTETTGDSLQLEAIEKEGYLRSPKIPHSLGTSGGSFEQPVIFKMWKEVAKEPLIGGSHVFGIDSSKTYTLNLVTGKKNEGEVEGDLRVSITRPSEVKPRDKYPWSFSIKAIGGGLLESDDEFMYLAPESGYEPKLEMQFDPTDSAWKRELSKQFFIRTRDGQVYGRVQIQVYSVYNVHSAIEVNYAVNPNGSRNLQP